MIGSDHDPAYKLHIQDLTCFEKTKDGWHFKFSEDSALTKVNLFQLQTEICKVTGFDNEILLVSDKTGKAKATRGPKVPGDFSWVKPGAYCSIVGMLVDSGKLPHVNIIKLAKLNNDILKEMWPLEVDELKLFITNKIAPATTI